MQSHFPAGEKTVLYISVITPRMHRRRFISALLSCRGYSEEMKALELDGDTVDSLCMSIHIQERRGLSWMKSYFLRNFSPIRVSLLQR